MKNNHHTNNRFITKIRFMNNARKKSLKQMYGTIVHNLIDNTKTENIFQSNISNLTQQSNKIIKIRYLAKSKPSLAPRKQRPIHYNGSKCIKRTKYTKRKKVRKYRKKIICRQKKTIQFFAVNYEFHDNNDVR